MAAVGSVRFKSLAAPDETIEMPGVVQHQVDVGDITVGRVVHEPGWRWSTHVRPLVGGDWCQARHVGIVLSGRLGIILEDGTTFDLEPDDVYEIPPGHDGYVIGHETVVLIEWSGLRAFTGFQSRRDRALATLLCTEIADPAPAQGGLGGVAWRDLRAQVLEHIRQELERCRGRELQTTDGGLLAALDGPAQALGCAVAARRRAARLEVELRAAVHVGEVEMVGEELRGAAVQETMRIVTVAAPGEILVSETTRALALSSGLRFDDRGTHTLDGLTGQWVLYAHAGGDG